MLVVIAGARPNFMKVAPLMKYLSAVLIHTGQHEGPMADVFLKELGLTVDYHLTHPALNQLTQLLGKLQPRLVIVVGDVDSTVDGALAAKANNLKLAHIEAGLRSGDLTMKEETNRILVDSLADYLFVSEPSGMANLQREGVRGQAYFVGNIMIDNLVDERQVLVTLHRPSNVDNPERLTQILAWLKKLNRRMVWPMHPRTAKRLQEFALDASFLTVVPPMNHQELVQTIKLSEFVITDSGGIQEEAVFLGRKTYTLRDSTERPITLDFGNQLIDTDFVFPEIPLWDGHTAKRIAEIIEKIAQGS